MEEVVKTYGKYVLAAITLWLLIMTIFCNIQDGEDHTGIREIIAAHIDTEKTDYHSYQDFETYQTESNKEYPIISYHDAGSLPVGNVYFLDQVDAVDYAGDHIPVKIEKMENITGDDLTGCVRDDGVIEFPDSGIYKITVSAKDDGNRNTRRTIAVPVM